MSKHNVLFALVLCLFVVVKSHGALDFDFSGTFSADNDVLLIDFTVAADSTITIFSSSWLAGNTTGVPINGFDPILGIWDSSGDSVAFQDDGGVVGSTLSNGVSYSHGVWDSYFSVFLAAGDYKASITQYNNFPVGTNLTDGFFHDGNPNFTFDMGWGPQAYFNGVWDIGSDARTGDWEFHVLNVADAGIVPEPASLAIWTLCGVAAVVSCRFKTNLGAWLR